MVLTFTRLLPTMKQVYGTSVHPPNRNDVILYKRYAGMASSCQPDPRNKDGLYKRLMLIPKSVFSVDSTMQITPPYVNKASSDMYSSYVDKSGKTSISPSYNDIGLYRRYVFH